MLLHDQSLRTIHQYCGHHRTLLERSASAGCFHCGETFAPAEIREWVQDRDAATGRDLEATAKCPRCGVSSVLPSAAPVALDAKLYAAMRTYWFDQVQ